MPRNPQISLPETPELPSRPSRQPLSHRAAALLALAPFLWLLAESAAAQGMVVHRIPPPRPQAPVELRLHRVEAEIRDQLATTTVEQVFYNPSGQRLEGSYLFPLPEGAQIERFTLEIDGEAVEAELLSAEKARQIYMDIVRRMQDPALLEYAGRGLLRLSVFPIEPRGERRVELRYSELLPRDGGLTAYSYPASGRLAAPPPTPSPGARSVAHGSGSLALRVRIETTRPLETVYSPSHSVEVRRSGDHRATVGFEEGREIGETDRRDFQLFFAPRPSGSGVSLEVLSFKDSDASWRRAGKGRREETLDEGTFLLLASPGALGRDGDTVPRDLTFVLDTSGSMAGAKLEQARRALTFCLENLNAEDRFEIVRFSTDVEPFFGELTPASVENRRRARRFLEEMRPIGGTAIDDALRAALEPAAHRASGQRDRPYVVIFLTDGRPTLGTTDTEKILDGARRAAGEGRGDSGRPRIFNFGIGTDINTHLLDRLAEHSRGRSQYVLPDEDIELKVSSFYRKIRRPVLVDLKLKFSDGVRVRQMAPRELPDLFDGDQLVVLGRYRGGGDVAITLEGRAAGRPFRQVDEARFDRGDSPGRLAVLPRLWAVRRVAYLLDQIRLHGESSELRDEVAELARRYGVVTPYTSYLIVEDEIARQVPRPLRSQRRLEEDRAVRDQAERNYSLWREAESGADAVGGARANERLKQVASAPTARDMHSEAGPAATEELKEAQQAPRMVQGKAFYNNAGQWIDADAQKFLDENAEAPRRVRFNSAEYFELLERHPEAQAWFSLGRNLLVQLGDRVIEVTEAERRDPR